MEIISADGRFTFKVEEWVCLWLSSALAAMVFAVCICYYNVRALEHVPVRPSQAIEVTKQ